MNLIKNILGKDISGIVYKYLVVNIKEVKFLREDACSKIKTSYWYCEYTNHIKFKPNELKNHNFIDWINITYRYNDLIN
jgi:hypothetical protein